MALQAGYLTLALAAGVPAAAGMTLLLFSSGGSSEVADEIGGGEMAALSDEDFDRLVERVELTVRAWPLTATHENDPFERLVRDALDELPDYLQATLADNVAVLVSDDGRRRKAYGLYHGATMAYGGHHSAVIVIYRDTLVRDFGDDHENLRRQVTTTVRHEVAHHLGATERRVAELGL